MTLRGRVSLFRHKTTRVQGMITKIGAQKMKMAKARIGELTGRAQRSISEGDVIEFLSRGEAEAIEYWRERGLLE